MAQFTREMGCTPADLIRWLPEALGDLYPHASLKLDGNILLSAQNPQLEMIGVSRPVRKSTSSSKIRPQAYFRV